MTVYIVMHADYGDDYPEAVFANEADAQAFKEKKETEVKKKKMYGPSYWISTMEVL